MRVTDRRLAPRNVAAIVKQDAARLGFDPSTFGGRSLRAGFVTSAVKRGANLIKITDVTGHNKSLEMLKTYGRDAEAFVGHAGALINNAGVNLIGAVEEDLCLLETGAPDRTFFAPTGQTAPFLEDGGRWIVEQAKHFKPLPGAAWSSGSCGQPLRGPFIACAASLGHSRSPEILDVSRR